MKEVIAERSKGALMAIARPRIDVPPQGQGHLRASQTRIINRARATFSRWMVAHKRAVLQSLDGPSLCHHEHRSLAPPYQNPSAASDAACLIKFQLLQGMQSRGGKVGVSISRCIRWMGSLSHTIISSECPLEALSSFVEPTGFDFL